MKRLPLLLLFTLFLCARADATWTVTKLGAAATSSVANSNCGGTNSCWSITVTSTTAGALIMIGMAGAASPALVFANNGCYDGGDTFTMLPSMAVTDTNGGSILGCYILSVSGGKTTIFINTTTAQPNPAWVYQGVYTSAPASNDGSGSADRTVACSSCAGISPTITGTSEVVFQFASGQNAVTAINQSYTGDFTLSDGGAFKVTTSTTAPNWTQTSGTMAVAYASFKETGGAATLVCNSISLLGVGCQ